MDEPGNDQGDTAFDLALAAYRRGEPSAAPQLAADDAALLSWLAPWLDSLPDALRDLAADPPDHTDADPEANVPAMDPVALMLGAAVDPELVVDGPRLRRARRAAGLDLGQLVARLQSRGWDVALHEALAWETGRLPFRPALLRALAEELGTSETSLRAGAQTGSDRSVDEWLSEPRIQAFLDDWAAEAGLPRRVVGGRVATALTTAGRRNRSDASSDALLAILHALRNVPGFLDSP